MKIYDMAFVIPFFPEKYPPGGINIVYQLSNRLASNGHSVCLIALRNGDNKKTHFSSPVPIKKKSKTRMILDRITHSNFGLKIIIPLIRKLEKVDYDFSIIENVKKKYSADPDDLKVRTKILVATSWATSFYVDSYVKKFGGRGIYFIQNLEDDPTFTPDLFDVAAKSYDLDLQKIVINSSMVERFKEDLPISVHIGVDGELFKLKNHENFLNRRIILFPLRASESKGAKYAIEAIKQISGRIESFEIHAYGDLPENIVPKGVVYHKSCRNSELVELLNHTAIFILPSLLEGFPVPPLEAMRCGAAIIATDIPGIRDYIVNGYNGILVPAADSKALENAILELISNEQDRIKMSNEGMLTSENYTYSKMYESFKRALKIE